MHTTFIEQVQIHLHEQLSRPQLFGLAPLLSSISAVSPDWFSLCSESNSLLLDLGWNAALAMVSRWFVIK